MGNQHRIPHLERFTRVGGGGGGGERFRLVAACISGVDLVSTMFPIDFCERTGTESLYTRTQLALETGASFESE